MLTRLLVTPIYAGVHATIGLKNGKVHLSTGDRDLDCMLAQDFDNLVFHSPNTGLVWDSVILTYPDITWRDIQSKLGIMSIRSNGINRGVVPVHRNQLTDPFLLMMKLHIQDRDVFTPVHVHSSKRPTDKTEVVFAEPGDAFEDIAEEVWYCKDPNPLTHTTPVGVRLISDPESEGDMEVNTKIYKTFSDTLKIIGVNYFMLDDTMCLRLLCEPKVIGVVKIYECYVTKDLILKHSFGIGDVVRVEVSPYDLFLGFVKELVEYRSKEQVHRPAFCPICNREFTNGSIICKHK